MSLYNMISGFNQACFFVAPLVVGHPQKNVPRFRDCFLNDGDHPENNGKIQIYTRVGGNNREYYTEEIAVLRGLNGYITDYDDDYDNTYATFVFDIPDEFKQDVEYYLKGNLKMTSKKYQKTILKAYPDIKDKLEKLFI